MSKYLYSSEQLRLLRSNPNVLKCSPKSITYSKDFKIKAINAYLEGKGPSTIFLEAGFDLEAIGMEKPKDCLKAWRKIYKNKGQGEVTKETRGRKPKDKQIIDIEYLETKIAYLEAENNFLRNLKTKTKN